MPSDIEIRPPKIEAKPGSHVSGSEHESITTLGQLLDSIEQVAEKKGHVALADVLKMIGRRSFGPLLLFAGLVTLAPLVGDIPGVPTVIGIFVVMVTGQLLYGRDHVWLPQWLLKRSAKGERIDNALRWLKPPARWIDRLTKERLTILVKGPAKYGIGLLGLFVGAMMPALEFIPFSANLAGAALTVFGLSLMAYDGLMALIAAGFTGGVVGVALYVLI